MEDSRFLTTKEVATLFRVDPTTVRRWVEAKALKAHMLPSRGTKHHYRFEENEVMAFFNITKIGDNNE